MKFLPKIIFLVSILLDSLNKSIEQMHKFRELEIRPEYLPSENNNENALSI